MNSKKAAVLVNALTESVVPREVFWTQLGRDAYEDMLHHGAPLWLTMDGFTDMYMADFKNFRLSSRYPTEPVMQFDNEADMVQFINDNREPDTEERTAEEIKGHVYRVTDRFKDVPQFDLEQKRAHAVYEYGPYLFLKLPTDPAFIQREGVDMEHCLSTAHHDYCSRMKEGLIDVYSMTDTRDNKPKVDIEVALVKPSYSFNKVAKPTVTQVRGIRNQVPPADDYIEPLMAFFNNYGRERGWFLSGHGVRNFDGQVDGDLLTQRWAQMQGDSQN